jgi:hypothetical protein
LIFLVNLCDDPSMPIPRSRISPGLFAAGLLCFLLPFLTVSCQGQRFIRLTGVQLVCGTTVKVPVPMGPEQNKKIDPNPFAVLAGITAIAGLALSFSKSGKALLAGAVSAGVSASSLFAMKSMLDGQTAQQGIPGIDLAYGVGYYLTLLFMFSACLWTFFFSRMPAGQREGEPGSRPLARANTA